LPRDPFADILGDCSATNFGLCATFRGGANLLVKALALEPVDILANFPRHWLAPFLLHCVRDGPDDVVALVDNGFTAVLFIDHLALVRLVGVSLVSFALLDADDLAVRNSFFFTNLLSHLLGDRHRHCRTSLLFNIFTLLHDNILANFISNIFANRLAGDGHFNVLAGFGRLVTTLVLFDSDAFFGDLVVAVLDAAVGATVEAAEAIVRAIDIQDTWAPAIRRSFSNASISRLQMDQRADGNVLVFGGCAGFSFYDFTD
jgi:hypothetical protein